MENVLHIHEAKLLPGLKTATGGVIKKGGAFLLLVILALFCFPVNHASAATLTDYSGTYIIDTNETDKTCTLVSATDYLGGDGGVPGTIRYYDEVNGVYIDYTVTAIGAEAYKDKITGYSGLERDDLPGTITSIGASAFQGCYNMNIVTMPGVKSIGASAFQGCYGLTSITIPSGVTAIADSTFQGCASLTSITIPEGVTSIGASAFQGCAKLTSITIPASVTSIGAGAFRGCDSLESITVAGANTNFISVDGVLLNKNQTALIQCPGGKTGSYTIPDSVTSIADYAFHRCSKLTGITIPNNFTSIKDYSFQGCSGLTGVIIPDDITSIGTWAFEGCSSLTSVTIPNGVTSIGDTAFANCGLTSITIPNSVTSIGTSFTGCNSLEKIYFDGHPGSIDENAFYVVEEVTRYFYSPTTSFSLCGTSTTVLPPYSITCPANDAYTITPSTTSGMPGETISLKIAVDAAYKLDSLYYNDGSNRTIPGTNFTMPSQAITVSAEVSSYYTYTGGSGICTITGYTGTGGNITIPSTLYGLTVTTIAASAFTNNTSLTGITIPEGVTSIGDYAFKGCTNLTSITIPEGVTSIGTGTFQVCSKLTSVTMPASLIKIDSYAFQNCISLTSVSIPKNVTSIGMNAFEGCSSLTSVTIPKGVTTLKSYLFVNCTSLAAVYFDGDKPTTISSNSFTGVPTSLIVYIPVGNTTYAGWNTYTKKEYLVYKGVQKKTDGNAIRFIAPISSLAPDEVGFVYSASNSEPPTIENASKLSTTTVYTSIKAGSSILTAADLGGTYVVACPVSEITGTIYVRTFVTRDSTTEYGPVSTITTTNLE